MKAKVRTYVVKTWKRPIHAHISLYMYVAIACYTCMHVHLDVHTRIYVAIAIRNLSAAFCNLYLLLYVRTYL